MIGGGMADNKQMHVGTTCDGHQRGRWSVKASDVIARVVITVGGIGTVLAVSAVFLFLVWVAAPLFRTATVDTPATVPVDESGDESIQMAVDEYQTLGWELHRNGLLNVFRLDTGATIGSPELFSDGRIITASALAIDRKSISLGRDDGTVVIGSIAFKTTFLKPGALPEKARHLTGGQRLVIGDGIVQRTPQGDFRLQRVAVDLRKPIRVASTPIDRIDHIMRGGSPIFVVLTAKGQLELNVLRSRKNLLTGHTTYSAKHYALPLEPRGGAPPRFVAISGQGDSVYVAWTDGQLNRFDVRERSKPVLAEQVDLIPRHDASLTALTPLLGRTTLVAGDSKGRVTAWFPVRTPGEATSDGRRLIAAHHLAGPNSAVRSLAASARSRLLTAGYEDGQLRLFQVTTEDTLISRDVARGRPIDRALLSPKDNALIAVAGGQLWRATLDAGYPEATFQSLFRPVWYEGYPGPQHVWQSGGGSEVIEPKLGLWPLVFGTLKASFYSMLFGAPLALLAAVYTSEFLHPRARSRVKPTVEMMASLPSVVLGFLAALVIAPYVEQIVPAVLTSVITIPLVLLLSAMAWQFLPQYVSVRLERWRLLFIFCALPLGCWAAFATAPSVENSLFAGDLMAWLDGQVGTATGGWFILLLPLAILTIALFTGGIVNPWLRSRTARWSRVGYAQLSLAKLLIGLLAAVGLTLQVALLITWSGFDPRGSLLNTYDQRNALVVGFVMGFAVVPIIYTIADDALTSVPNHLRYGSLGAGATVWQTTVRIVIPTAVSGLFSALMIGFGRAVGETMIVLMAAGNTPILELNIFNGFRTLAANIAVELPEAARNSTHYRTLFVAALTLFLLTFVVNTLAEVVRLRFRRRAHQL